MQPEESEQDFSLDLKTLYINYPEEIEFVYEPHPGGQLVTIVPDAYKWISPDRPWPGSEDWERPSTPPHWKPPLPTEETSFAARLPPPTWKEKLKRAAESSKNKENTPLLHRKGRHYKIFSAPDTKPVAQKQARRRFLASSNKNGEKCEEEPKLERKLFNW